MIYSVSTIIKFLKVLLPILVVELFVFGSCNKNSTRPCLNGGYNFIATCELIYQKDVYNIGDTIYLQSTIPKILVNQAGSSSQIDYSNSAGIGGDIGIGRIDSVAKQNRPGRDSFLLTSSIGTFLERAFNQSQGINFSYHENSNNYQFKGGFICKKKGVYSIAIDNPRSTGIRGKNCTNAVFNIALTNADTHWQLYQNLLGVTLSNYDKQHIYCFRVQ